MVFISIAPSIYNTVRTSEGGKKMESRSCNVTQSRHDTLVKVCNYFCSRYLPVRLIIIVILLCLNSAKCPGPTDLHQHHHEAADGQLQTATQVQRLYYLVRNGIFSSGPTTM
jgi:hypothetical protein